MAWQLKILVTRVDKLSLNPGTHMVDGKTTSQKLFTGLLKCVMAQKYTNKINKIYFL